MRETLKRWLDDRLDVDERTRDLLMYVIRGISIGLIVFGTVGELAGWFDEIGLLSVTLGVLGVLVTIIDTNGRRAIHLLEEHTRRFDGLEAGQETLIEGQQTLIEGQEATNRTLERIAEILDDRLPEGT